MSSAPAEQNAITTLTVFGSRILIGGTAGEDEDCSHAGYGYRGYRKGVADLECFIVCHDSSAVSCGVVSSSLTFRVQDGEGG